MARRLSDVGCGGGCGSGGVIAPKRTKAAARSALVAVEGTGGRHILVGGGAQNRPCAEVACGLVKATVSAAVRTSCAVVWTRAAGMPGWPAGSAAKPGAESPEGCPSPETTSIVWRESSIASARWTALRTPILHAGGGGGPADDGRLLTADDEAGPCLARADEPVKQQDAGHRAGAGVADVEGQRLHGADLTRDDRSERGLEREPARADAGDRGGDEDVQLGGGVMGAAQTVACGVDGEAVGVLAECRVAPVADRQDRQGRLDRLRRTKGALERALGGGHTRPVREGHGRSWRPRRGRWPGSRCRGRSRGPLRTVRRWRRA